MSLFIAIRRHFFIALNGIGFCAFNYSDSVCVWEIRFDFSVSLISNADRTIRRCTHNKRGYGVHCARSEKFSFFSSFSLLLFYGFRLVRLARRTINIYVKRPRLPYVSDVVRWHFIDTARHTHDNFFQCKTVRTPIPRPVNVRTWKKIEFVSDPWNSIWTLNKFVYHIFPFR